MQSHGFFGRGWGSRCILYQVPNQQRTLNKLPTEFQCKNFVNNYRLSMQVGAKRAKTCMQCVLCISTELLFCIPLLVVKDEIFFCPRGERSNFFFASEIWGWCCWANSCLHSRTSVFNGFFSSSSSSSSSASPLGRNLTFPLLCLILPFPRPLLLPWRLTFPFLCNAWLSTEVPEWLSFLMFLLARGKINLT